MHLGPAQVQHVRDHGSRGLRQVAELVLDVVEDLHQGARLVLSGGGEAFNARGNRVGGVLGRAARHFTERPFSHFSEGKPLDVEKLR